MGVEVFEKLKKIFSLTKLFFLYLYSYRYCLCRLHAHLYIQDKKILGEFEILVGYTLYIVLRYEPKFNNQ